MTILVGIENTDTEIEERDNQSRNNVHLEVQDLRRRIIQAMVPEEGPIEILDPEMGGVLIRAIDGLEKAEQWRAKHNFDKRKHKDMMQSNQEQTDAIGGVASIVLSALDRQRKQRLADAQAKPISTPTYTPEKLEHVESNKLAIANPKHEQIDVDQFRYEMIDKGLDPKRVIVDGRIVERDLDAEEAAVDAQLDQTT